MNGYSNKMVWTTAILAAVERKRQAGVSLKAIAQVLGCSYESLRAARFYELRKANSHAFLEESEALDLIASAGTSPADAGKIR